MPTKRLRVRGPRDGLNGRVEQETRFATMTANGTIKTKRLIQRKRAHRVTEFLAHREPEGPTGQAHEAIVNGTITTPQTATVELTQAKRLNERSGGHGPSFIGEPPHGRFPTRRKDHAPTTRARAV